MSSIPMLTIKIEIDQIQCENIEIASISDLYPALETFFQTYHFSDRVTQQKIKERILASLQNNPFFAQKSMNQFEFKNNQSLFTQIKENIKSPILTAKESNYLLQTDLKERNKTFHDNLLNQEECQKYKSTTKLIENRSNNKQYLAGSAFLKNDFFREKTKNSINKVEEKSKKLISKITNVEKKGNSEIMNRKLTSFNKIFPKLNFSKNLKTLKEIQRITRNSGFFAEKCINNLESSNKNRENILPTENQVSVYDKNKKASSEKSIVLKFKGNKTDRNIKNDGFYPNSELKRPLKSKNSTNSNFDASNWMEYTTGKQGSTQKGFKSLMNVYREDGTNKPACVVNKYESVETENQGFSTKKGFKSLMNYREEFQDKRIERYHNDDYLKEMSVQKKKIVRGGSQLRTPCRNLEKNVKTAEINQKGLKYNFAGQIRDFPVEIFEENLLEIEYQKFRKLNRGNSHLWNLFCCFDEKKIGVISQNNLNLLGVNSEVLDGFMPVITHIFDSHDKQDCDFEEFLGLVFRYHVNF